MRLIDADAFAVEIKQISSQLTHMMSTNGVLAVLDEQPTVEAEPVRHGHWTYHEIMGVEWARCSECGDAERDDTPWCPNCGARMR